MSDIATIRGMKIQQAIERMTMLFDANPAAGNVWKAQVRQASAQVQMDIETLAEANNLSGLQALDVGAHAAWPGAPDA